MIRMVLASALLMAGVLGGPADAAAGRGQDSAAARPPAGVTAADVAPFTGDWVLALQSPDGPRTGELAVTAENEKVTATLDLGDQPSQAIADITRSDKSLVLRYTFDYQGTAVDTAITLTPAADGRLLGRAIASHVASCSRRCFSASSICTTSLCRLAR